MFKKFQQLALVQALVATFGSLYFSDVMGLTPCKLCWYQRIAMYPLVVIFAVSLWLKDKRVIYYAMPLVIIGWVIALYHSVEYYDANLNLGISDIALVNCSAGVSCTDRQILWLGFISIPLMAFTAFSVIGFCIWKMKGLAEVKEIS